ncbi:phospholipid carrier-dependent glycosyltransferase [Prosthecochloris sp. ZM]|uniref:ArnT family glycosyltransferase n=1 Tax=Prosthecochloris sp. ZM TaxID=2283143 RepID=UPI000DF7B6B4|nr:glycosyltransferase family 39 protein [Prosthecochloris sp. ZM]RDD29772.1 phospholipid carrier-dependent glycosyltransferase [Prosthecochloris sp. ZM]
MQPKDNAHSLQDMLILAFLCIVSFYAWTGSVPLFDVDEGAFSEATREMLKSGNYLTTYLNGEPRFDKPILIYWLQLASISLFGINEFAFRLPSALASTLWAASIYLFAGKMLDRRAGFIAAAAMIPTLQITMIAKAAIADALLNSMLAISMFSIFLYYKERQQRFVLIAFTAIGLGTLTKGPVAILIPLVVSAIFFLSQRETKAWLKAIFNPSGIALFLLIVLPWYTLEYLDQGMRFIEGFILKHNIERFSTPFEQHTGSIWYYLPVLLAGLTPSTGLIIPLATEIKKLVKTPLSAYLLIWFGFVFLFFSFSGTKLPHYIIYGYTPLFILFAMVFKTIKKPWLLGIWPALILVALSMAPLFIARIALSASNPYIRDLLHGALKLMGPEYTILLVSIALITLLVWTAGKIPARYRLAATGAIFCLAFNQVIMTRAGELLQQPVKEAALLARNNGYKIVMWKVNYPSFLVYSGNSVEKRAPKPGEIVFTSVKYIDRLNASEILYQKNGLVLAKIQQ